jgi:hypothetical protein
MAYFNGLASWRGVIHDRAHFKTPAGGRLLLTYHNDVMTGHPIIKNPPPDGESHKLRMIRQEASTVQLLTD